MKKLLDDKFAGKGKPLSYLRRLAHVGTTKTRDYLLCVAARAGALSTKVHPHCLLGINELLDLDVTLGPCKPFQQEGGTPLHLAIVWGRLKVAKVLLDAECDVNT